jgi:hypothetical protein
MCTVNGSSGVVAGPVTTVIIQCGPQIVWSSAPGVSGINALTVSNGVIYFGGSFTTVAGATRNYLAAIDASSGELLPWNPSVDPNPANAQTPATVNAIVVVNGVVFAGGSFNGVAGQEHLSLAAIEASSGQVLPWRMDTYDSRPPFGATIGTVNVLVASGSSVYIGGGFNEIGGVGRNLLAVIDANTGVVLPWTAALNTNGGNVSALSIDGPQIYAAGFFSGPSLAAFNLSSGSSLPWQPDIVWAGLMCDLEPTTLVSVAAYGEAVFIAGQFVAPYNTCPPYPPSPGFAAVSTVTGKLLPWHLDVDNSVAALVVAENTVYVGGNFTSVGGIARNNLAAIDAITGAVLPWNPNANGPVRALALSGNTVYAAGGFASIDGTTRYSLAAIDGTTGAVVQ